MFTDMLSLGNGGGYTPSIIPDTNNLLGSITTVGGSYTATEDCVMMIRGMKATSATEAYITINGKAFIRIFNASSDGMYMPQNDYGIFIPKDTVVGTKNGTGNSYNIEFYKCA